MPRLLRGGPAFREVTFGNAAPPASCQADLDGDCTVGVLDLLLLLSEWGPCS